MDNLLVIGGSVSAVKYLVWFALLVGVVAYANKVKNANGDKGWDMSPSHLWKHKIGIFVMTVIFITVVGEQIVVESVLWSVDDVADVAGFNNAVLRTHKYFPLSTISLDTMANGDSVYHMFGALSASSLLSNVVLEIDMLANNVIQATQAYAEFLTFQPTPELA